MFDLQGIQKEMEALSRSADSILDPAINERMKMLSKGEIQGNGKKDFMQILLELMEQKDIGISVDLVKIKAILVDIIIGRRICAGLPLAEKMVMPILASLLHSFDWELPEGENVDLSEGFGLVIKKSKRLFAIPTTRLPHLDLYQ
ncbi:hypothetical protein K7X08_029294 [Anisodus acutangulus]|uniref:Cytochrome P450 n=1 Tax=Anisodus acutangulus TaxID=402998 RepID=A0A9Q1QTN6_9SOLA|nr:hypothetical protein K7X08_029294 [Anisodus acutangulus]